MRRALLGRRTFALLTCGVGVALSFLVFGAIRSRDRKRTEEDFRHASNNRVAALQAGLRSNGLLLESLAAFFAGSQEVTRQEFRTFVEPFLEGAGGFQALEWIPRVPDTRRVGFEASARRDGLSQFKITERQSQGRMVPASRRKEHYPVFYVEPSAGNEVAFGFDLASDPERLRSLEKARDLGATAATGKITLVQEKGDQAGVLVFHPVYAKGSLLDSTESRRKHIEGFVLEVLRVGDFVEQSLSPLSPAGIDVRIYDGPAQSPDRLLHFHASRTRNSEPPGTDVMPDGQGTSLRQTALLDAFGRQWMVLCTPSPEFIAAQSSWQAWSSLAAGLLVTGLIAAYLLSSAAYVRRQRHALEALAESQRNLAAVFDAAPVGILLVDNSGAVVRVNDVAAKVLGKSPAEMANLPPGKALNCIHATDAPRGCGHGPACASCPVRAAIVGVLTSGQPVRGLEVQPILTIGETQVRPWLELSAEPVTLDGKRHVIVSVDNITDRKEAEEEIERLSKFPSENPYPVLRVAGDREILYANAAGEQYLEASGCKAGQRIPADLGQLVSTALESGSAGRKEVETHGRILTFHAAPVAGAGYVNLYAVDTTERKRAEQQLQQRMDELGQFNRLAVGREGRMIELKREVNEMARKAGAAPPYDLAFAESAAGVTDDEA